MRKLDLRKDFRDLYSPSARRVEIVKVPKLNYLMIDGKMEPGASPESSAAFQAATAAIYGAAFTLKFMSKFRTTNPLDYPVMALEGLWWVRGGEFDVQKKDLWQWTLMIMQPKHIGARMFQEALRQLEQKRPGPALSKLRLERFEEGLCIQTMHVGPYSEEPQTIARLREFASEKGYILRGKHHEIYLGDPRRAKPEKLRTVLRHPVAQPK